MIEADSVHSAPRRFTPKIVGGTDAPVQVATKQRKRKRRGGRGNDPIFAAIEAYRQADAACISVDGDIPDELMDQRCDAYDEVLQTRPTTPAGLVALTSFAREQADENRKSESML